MRDLAIRLVRLQDDEALAEAYDLAASAYQSMLNANGPDENATVNARSARGFAARKFGELLERRGAEERARELLQQAYDDATDVLARKRRLLPRREHLVSQERVAAAQAVNGDERGIDLLRVVLGKRLDAGGRNRAEVRWTAEDLRAALLRFGRAPEAAEVERTYLAGPDHADQV